MAKTMQTPVHTNFELAFKDGYVFRGADPEIVVRVCQVGTLELPSGQILASDPGTLDLSVLDQMPFVRKVPPGKYPASVCLATVGPNHNRVACGRLQFTDKPTVRWEMALKQGQKLEDLGEDEIFGYGVDCGTGCFVDPKSFAGLDFDSYEELVEKLWQNMDANGGEWGELALPGGNLVAFHSGWGDGFYPCYFGLDAEGNVTCLITDFEVLVRSIDAQIELSNLPEHFGKKVSDAELREAGTEITVQPVRGKPRSLLLEVVGRGMPSVDIKHDVPHPPTRSTTQYNRAGKTIELDFDIELKDARVTIQFSKGVRALE
jgi:hypothetical protein